MLLQGQLHSIPQEHNLIFNTNNQKSVCLFSLYIVFISDIVHTLDVQECLPCVFLQMLLDEYFEVVSVNMILLCVYSLLADESEETYYQHIEYD